MSVFWLADSPVSAPGGYTPRRWQQRVFRRGHAAGGASVCDGV